MSNKLIINSVAGKTPTTTNLKTDQFGINTKDGKMFVNTGSAIKELGGIPTAADFFDSPTLPIMMLPTVLGNAGGFPEKIEAYMVKYGTQIHYGPRTYLDLTAADLDTGNILVTVNTHGQLYYVMIRGYNTQLPNAGRFSAVVSGANSVSSSAFKTALELEYNTTAQSYRLGCYITKIETGESYLAHSSQCSLLKVFKLPSI